MVFQVIRTEVDDYYGRLRSPSGEIVLLTPNRRAKGETLRDIGEVMCLAGSGDTRTVDYL